MASRNVAVIGAGVAGLASALALARRGHTVEVFEGATSPRRGGGPLWLWPNAARALEALDLWPAVLRSAHVVSRHTMQTAHGEVLLEFPIDWLAHRFGAPLTFISREQLAEELLDATSSGDAAQRIEIRYDTPVEGFAETSGGVRPIVHGRAWRSSYDVLVGADGFHSAIRAQVQGHVIERRAAYQMCAGSTRIDPEGWPYAIGEVASVMTNGRILVHGTAAERTHLRVYWIAWDRGPRPLDAQYPHPRLRALIRNADDHVWFPVRDRPPTRVGPQLEPPWGAGRVTLVGDAAHSMMPDLGQGACQSLESANLLAERLSCGCRTRSAADSLRAYERERAARTGRIVRFAWTMNGLLAASFPGSEVLKRLAVRSLWKPYLFNEYRYLMGHERVPSLLVPSPWTPHDERRSEGLRSS